MSDLALSRRAVARALIALPVIAAPVAASATTGLACSPTSDAAAWNDALARFLDAEARARRTYAEWDRLNEKRTSLFGETHPRFDMSADETAWREAEGFNALGSQCDAVANEECNLRRELMNMPAPHMAAVKWKADYLLAPEGRDDDYTASWSLDYVRQFLFDVAHFAGEA